MSTLQDYLNSLNQKVQSTLNLTLGLPSGSVWQSLYAVGAAKFGLVKAIPLKPLGVMFTNEHPSPLPYDGLMPVISPKGFYVSDNWNNGIGWKNSPEIGGATPDSQGTIYTESEAISNYRLAKQYLTSFDYKTAWIDPPVNTSGLYATTLYDPSGYETGQIIQKPLDPTTLPPSELKDDLVKASGLTSKEAAAVVTAPGAVATTEASNKLVIIGGLLLVGGYLVYKHFRRAA